MNDVKLQEPLLHYRLNEHGQAEVNTEGFGFPLFSEDRVRAAILADRQQLREAREQIIKDRKELREARATVKESLTVQDERAAFEAWFADHHGYHPKSYGNQSSGDYRQPFAQWQYVAWQARAKLAPVADVPCKCGCGFAFHVDGPPAVADKLAEALNEIGDLNRHMRYDPKITFIIRAALAEYEKKGTPNV